MLATTIHKSNTTPHHQSRATTRRHPQRNATPLTRGTGLLSQSPIVCSMIIRETLSRAPRQVCCLCTRTGPTTGQTAHPTNRSAHRTPTHCGRGISLVVLLRKEVIQPHLPVRLPCYDFVPIADPTFDSSLPTRGLSHWLRVLPTFVT